MRDAFADGFDGAAHVAAEDGGPAADDEAVVLDLPVDGVGGEGVVFDEDLAGAGVGDGTLFEDEALAFGFEDGAGLGHDGVGDDRNGFGIER